MSFERLIGEHDRIEELAALLEAAAGSSAHDVFGVAASIGELALAITDHRGNEQRSVYTRLLNGRDPTASRLVSSFADEFRTLEQDWEAYLSDWTPECIAADWATFRVETLELLMRIRQRVRKEGTLIYPIALQRGAIRLRAV